MSFADSMEDLEHALSKKSDGRSIQRIPLDRIRSDPHQPRKSFDQQALEEMAQSIKERGVLQPITVRTLDEGKSYVIRFGDRRFRAAALAGLSDIPAIVIENEPDENERLDQVIENDQRADLSAIEMADAIQDMIANGLSKEAISRRLGRPRLDITMYAALPGFPPELAGDFIMRSSLRAAYDLFVAWKTAPADVLTFVAANPDGVTAARTAAFVKALKAGAGPLHVQRPEEPKAPTVETAGKARKQPIVAPELALDLSPAEAGISPPQPPAAPSPVTAPADTVVVYVPVRVGGRAARVRLPDMVEVAFDDGELLLIAATEIDKH